MNRLLHGIVVSALGAAALLSFTGVGTGAAQTGAPDVPRLAAVSTSLPPTNQSAPRFTDNAQESTAYCDSPIDCRRQAAQYAKEMQARGYNTEVHPMTVDRQGDGRYHGGGFREGIP
jgi:hypothetical protein